VGEIQRWPVEVDADNAMGAPPNRFRAEVTLVAPNIEHPLA
jgi:hypothetical protein